MQSLPHLRLVIAGDGPERGRLQLLASTLKLANVEFAGHVRGAEVGRARCKSGFTVLPWHGYETLGKTILESYAKARGVVASDLGSRQELVHAGETGLLYKTGDVKALVSAIEFLSSKPELADQMGRAGRERVQQNYTPKAHYEALIGLYERLAEGRRELASRSTSPLPLQRTKLRVAFIGGRGVVSKYSGIETYYEEIGRRLTGMGHEVTVYCRTYFTPPTTEHNGVQVVRLPTIRPKHLQTLVTTFLGAFE